MLSDQDLTDFVRAYPSCIPRDKMKASFYRSKGLECYWYGGINKGSMEIKFPDYFRDAPGLVIIELTKKIIQNSLYDSDYDLSPDAKRWMIGGLNTPEKVRIYIERNGFTEIAQYNDAIVVSSDGDVVDSSMFFNVISVPKELIDLPETERIIASTYEGLKADRESFLEV